MTDGSEYDSLLEDPFGHELPGDDVNEVQASSDRPITQSGSSIPTSATSTSSSDFYLSQPHSQLSQPSSNHRSNRDSDAYISDASDNDDIIPPSVYQSNSQLLRRPIHATPFGSKKHAFNSQSINKTPQHSQRSQFTQPARNVVHSAINQPVVRSSPSPPVITPRPNRHTSFDRSHSDVSPPEVDGGFAGFATAGGTAVTVSAKNQRRARAMLDEITITPVDGLDECMPVETSIAPKSNGMFTSGSGKPVAFSKKAEEQARRFMAEVSEDAYGVTDGHDFQTPLRTRQPGSFTAPRALASKSGIPKCVTEDRDRVVDSFHPGGNDTGSFGGFKTAGGSSLSISAKNRAIAMQKFADIATDDDHTVSNETATVHSTNIDEPSLGFGFKTAGGSAVSISAKNRALAAQLYNPDNQLDATLHDDEPITAATGGGFSTASKKPIPVSAQNRAIAARSFELDGDQQTAPPAANGIGSLFATASGKKVTLSVENQARARKFMEDMDNDSAQNSAPPTAAAAPRLFEPLSHIVARKQTRTLGNPVTPHVTAATSMSGFSTGGGKTVAISAEVQARAARLLASFNEEISSEQSEHEHTSRMNEPSSLLSMRKGGASTGPEKNSTAFRPPAPVRSSTKSQLQDISNFNHMQPPTKRRRLAFQSPRPLVKTKQVLATPNSKIATPKKQVLTAAQVAAAALSKLPQPPPFDTSADTIKFSMANHEVELLSVDELEQLGVHSELIHMTSLSALDFAFSMGDDARHGADSMLASLIQSGCDARLINLDWVANHWRWVVWKLACMERRHPHELLGKCLTYSAVFRQLKRRYQREFEDVKRSAVRLIVERDETPSRFMVLSVASVKDDWSSVDNDKHPFMCHLGAGGGGCDIELTDGWYGIACKLDAGLQRALAQGRLHVGMKLRVFNARLEGESGDAEPPLEVRGSHLSLSVNSTRHATDTMKLGFQATAGFPVSFRSLQVGGGCAPIIYGFVSKIYPLAYMETLPDQSKVHRNEEGEHLAHRRWEEECERASEQFNAQRESRQYMSEDRESCFAPTPSASVTDQMQDGLPPGMPEQRTVTPIMRIRLREWMPSGCLIDDLDLVESGAECQLTIWRPTEFDSETIREGALLAVFAASVQEPYGLKKDLQLTSSRNAPLISLGQTLESVVAAPHSMNQLDTLMTWQEFDTSMIAVAVSRSADNLLVTCFDETSVRMLLIHVKNDDRQCNPSLANMKVPAVLTARNLEYQSYQSTYGFHEARSSILTSFSIGGKTAAPRIKPRALALESMMNVPSMRVLTSLQQERVERMESGMCGDDSLDTKIASALAQLMMDV